MSLFSKIAAFFSGEERVHQCAVCGGHVVDEGTVIVTVTPAATPVMRAGSAPILIDRTPNPYWKNAAAEETQELPPFALTEAHMAALEAAVRREGYNVLANPETGDVTLDKPDSLWLAVSTLVRIHTRDHEHIGFTVESSPGHGDPFYTQAEYIKAWETLRNFLHHKL